jgi:hypothetical protein
MKSSKSSFILFLIFAATALWAWSAGDRCLGQWSDGYWYPATIVSAEDGVYNVAFDDGDTSSLSDSQVKAIDWRVGTAIECNWKGGGSYYPGRITKKSGDSIHISYDDGDEEDTTIGKCRSMP